MRIDSDRLKRLCRERGITLQRLLNEAKVSKTAYYSLVRKESILPRSVERLTSRLGVSPTRFLDDPDRKVQRLRELQRRAEAICRRHPDIDRDVVLRTLMNLDLPPLERLRKALIRGRKLHLHR